MESKNVIKLDLNFCNSLNDIHEKIRLSFGFPEWYGKNPDAFWDLLNEPRENTIVEVYGYENLSPKLKSKCEVLLTILEDNKKFFDEFVKKYNKPELKFDYKIIS